MKERTCIEDENKQTSCQDQTSTKPQEHPGGKNSLTIPNSDQHA
jgi:hypothetical protein